MKTPLLTTATKPFWEPTEECVRVLNTRTWICSYSGGKDSTSLVTWIEWLRRTKRISVQTPRLVMSDTGVEFPFLQRTSEGVLAILNRQSGWKCEVVLPTVRNKLYCQIFGRGHSPIYPGIRKMRWCTRATKIEPMERFAKTLDKDGLLLTGVRWGESQTRDGKLSASGCSAGGECGLPPLQKEGKEGPYGPIVNWKTCQVVDWLSGLEADCRETIPDLLACTKELLSVYRIKKEESLGLFPSESVASMRFGCIGCPAITNDKTIRMQIPDNPSWKHLRRLYGIWHEMYKPDHRICRPKGEKMQQGPVKMASRKKFFKVLMEIQEKSGVTLVTEEDIAFIKQCWKNKVYPRGWSAADDV